MGARFGAALGHGANASLKRSLWPKAMPDKAFASVFITQFRIAGPEFFHLRFDRTCQKFPCASPQNPRLQLPLAEPGEPL